MEEAQNWWKLKIKSLVNLHFEIKILLEGADLDKQDKG